MTDKLPFGFRFFENIPQSGEELLPEPEYYEDDGLSYVIDSSGNRVPFVTYVAINMGITRTGMTTKATVDEPDQDYVKDTLPNRLGTRTVTEVAREMTDNDPTT